MSELSAYLISLAMIIVMKIVCFILGYLTIRLGYQLVSSGIKGEFKFSANFGGFKADLASVSPGLLFVFLGIFLIGYAIHVEKGVELTMGSRGMENKPDPPIASPASLMGEAAEPDSTLFHMEASAESLLSNDSPSNLIQKGD